MVGDNLRSSSCEGIGDLIFSSEVENFKEMRPSTRFPLVFGEIEGDLVGSTSRLPSSPGSMYCKRSIGF